MEAHIRCDGVESILFRRIIVIGQEDVIISGCNEANMRAGLTEKNKITSRPVAYAALKVYSWNILPIFNS